MDDDTGRKSAPGTPRWVKLFGIITLIAAVLFVLLKFVGGAGHGPARHMPRGNQTSSQSSH